MRNIISVILLFLVIDISAQNISIPIDTIVTTSHQVKIKGKVVNYTAKAGTQPVWDKDGKVIATLMYTYYQKKNVSNKDERPLLISFNGGPGSASVWMHIAYTGPKILRIDDEGFPIQPYGIKDNNYSVLDIADIVFVNPVNTGYSRIVDKETDKKTFFGVNTDIKYLAKWVNTFVSRNNLWKNPKYLIGESYGTTRVSGLALELQNQHWMYLNGVILVSPTDLGIKRDGPVKKANRLPYFTAAAWYHKKLSDDLQKKDLLEVLKMSEEYTVNTLISTMSKGGFVSDEERNKAAERMSYFSGISTKVILQNNLDLSTSYFWKELLRDQGKTIGRLDSRYLGIDEKDAGTRPDYNAELTSWLHSFTPAINHYYKNILNFKTDIKYNMFGPVHPWDRTRNNTGKDLRLAMAENPYLNLMIQSGYYDGATTYYDAKYTMWNIDSGGKLKDRMEFKGYRSGHMMYLRKEDLEKANEDLRVFIDKSKAKGSAKY
ncbi:MAG: carboxypeptidase [Flavobacteriaceae bacterium]|nr:carboxypeptidase [Flavobacteriaceae bacterium]